MSRAADAVQAKQIAGVARAVQQAIDHQETLHADHAQSVYCACYPY